MIAKCPAMWFPHCRFLCGPRYRFRNGGTYTGQWAGNMRRARPLQKSARDPSSHFVWLCAVRFLSRGRQATLPSPSSRLVTWRALVVALMSVPTLSSRRRAPARALARRRTWRDCFGRASGGGTATGSSVGLTALATRRRRLIADSVGVKKWESCIKHMWSEDTSASRCPLSYVGMIVAVRQGPRISHWHRLDNILASKVPLRCRTEAALAARGVRHATSCLSERQRQSSCLRLWGIEWFQFRLTVSSSVALWALTRRVHQSA